MPAGAKGPPGPLQQEIAATLRAKMGRDRLSIQQVAASVAISRSQLSDIVNGKKHVDAEQLDDICFVLGLDSWTVMADAAKATPGRFLNRADLKRLEP